MRILVIGGSGVIGSYFVKELLKKNTDFKFTYLTHKFGEKETGYKLDITKKDQVIKIFDRVQPDVVIHTCAITNVDLCETDKMLARSINVEGTKNIVSGCKKNESKLVYISTSSVFDGKKKKYFETDTPCPSTYYGITKYEAEKLVMQSGLSYLILRTDQPYCWVEKWQHTNSVLRVIEKLKRNEYHKEVCDWYNTPTYVPDFVNAACMLIDDDMEGIFHVVGSDFINRYEWAIQTADVFKLDKKLIIPVSSDLLHLPVKRPNVYLSNDKLYKEVRIRMMGTLEGLHTMYYARSSKRP